MRLERASERARTSGAKQAPPEISRVEGAVTQGALDVSDDLKGSLCYRVCHTSPDGIFPLVDPSLSTMVKAPLAALYAMKLELAKTIL